MKYVKKICTFHPVATKIRNSDTIIVVRPQKQQKKIVIILRKLVKNVNLFMFGTSLDHYVKPEWTSADCFFILVNLHSNLRFIVLFTDLVLEWGGFLVWIVFTLVQLLVCPGLAFFYTFLGNYGARTFLNLWDILPVFQGISLCVIVCNLFKMIDTVIIVTSGIMSFPFFFTLGEDLKQTNQILNCSSRAKYIPGVANSYGISAAFTNIGYNQQSNYHVDWELDVTRIKCAAIVWFVIMFVRIFTFKRFRIFPVRIIPILFLVMLLLLVITSSILNGNPVVSAIYRDNRFYFNLVPYLQVFTFALSDYLPSHWVTLGYLSSPKTITAQVWGIGIIKILLGFLLLYGIPFFAESFREYINAVDDKCIQFFGLHFFFVIIPLSLRQNFKYHASFILYILYMFLILGSGVCQLLITLEMVVIGLYERMSLVYRFRNLVFIITGIFVYVFSIPFCVKSAHYILFYLNVQSYDLAFFILLMMTVLGIGLYGLERINADYHYFHGIKYPNITMAKLLFIVCFGATLLYVLKMIDDTYRLENNDYIYILIAFVCLLPFFIGVIHNCSKKKSYHGFCYPLVTWGRPKEILRTARRRKNLRQMFIYRTRCECNHSCLLRQKQLVQAVEEELTMRAEHLGEIIEERELIKVEQLLKV